MTDPTLWHEAANLFPLLGQQDLDELAEDIRQHGLLNPIALYDEKVLDGRNRALACARAGVEPRYVQWDASGLSPVVWVISQNLVRRQLSTGQRAAVAVEGKELLAVEARQKQLANLRQGRKIPLVLNNEKTEKPLHVEKAVAKKFEVSQGYVYAAQKIKDADEKVFQRVKSGAISIPEAQKELGFKHNTRMMVSTDSNEWYSPRSYVEAAKAVMGKIDLDPASCELADKYIKAAKYYTKETDGLKHKWSGRVWLNPPYADAGPKFVAKLIQAFESGQVTEAILVVNSHSTDSKWFKPLFQYLLCFTDHRTQFWNADGVGQGSTHGSVLVYFGKNPDQFKKHFQRFGSVVQSV